MDTDAEVTGPTVQEGPAITVSLIIDALIVGKLLEVLGDADIQGDAGDVDRVRRELLDADEGYQVRLVLTVFDDQEVDRTAELEDALREMLGQDQTTSINVTPDDEPENSTTIH